MIRLQIGSISCTAFSFSFLFLSVTQVALCFLRLSPQWLLENFWGIHSQRRKKPLSMRRYPLAAGIEFSPVFLCPLPLFLIVKYFLHERKLLEGFPSGANKLSWK
jgi:hypothetical protein